MEIGKTLNAGTANLLDLFLTYQAQLVEEILKGLSLDAIRKCAYEKASFRNSSFSYFQNALQKGLVTCFSEFIYAKELEAIWPLADPTTSPHDSSAVTFSFFADQASAGVAEELLRPALASEGIRVRSGFIQSEYLVYESLLLGYDGVCVHARGLDRYTMQFLLELCRDLGLIFIPLAESRESLDEILETDAPTVGIWSYRARDLQPDWRVFTNLESHIPKNCQTFVFMPRPNEKELALLKERRVASVIFPTRIPHLSS
jgi:hypothetical protein